MKTICALLLLLPLQVFAARIVSDPYPANCGQPVCPQPEQCGYKEQFAPIAPATTPTFGPVVTSATESVTGGKRCNIDISTFSNGSHTLQVFARSSIWGDSVNVPFVFSAGAPAVPAGLRLVP